MLNNPYQAVINSSVEPINYVYTILASSSPQLGAAQKRATPLERDETGIIYSIECYLKPSRQHLMLRQELEYLADERHIYVASINDPIDTITGNRSVRFICDRAQWNCYIDALLRKDMKDLNP
jgi:hypothetical protein